MFEHAQKIDNLHKEIPGLLVPRCVFYRRFVPWTMDGRVGGSKRLVSLYGTVGLVMVNTPL